jgi:hypothetical protein
MCTNPCTGASYVDSFCGFPRCRQVNVSVLSTRKLWGVGRKKNLPLHVHVDSVVIFLVALSINPLRPNEF